MRKKLPSLLLAWARSRVAEAGADYLEFRRKRSLEIEDPRERTAFDRETYQHSALIRKIQIEEEYSDVIPEP